LLHLDVEFTLRKRVLNKDEKHKDKKEYKKLESDKASVQNKNQGDTIKSNNQNTGKKGDNKKTGKKDSSTSFRKKLLVLGVASLGAVGLAAFIVYLYKKYLRKKKIVQKIDDATLQEFLLKEEQSEQTDIEPSTSVVPV
jgi:hypothetical protein